MLHSLKTKFILAFGAVIILIFVALGGFLIDQKNRELSSDISVSSRSFAQFTAASVVDAYSQFLEPGNFLPFTREIDGLLRQNEGVSAVTLSRYSGEILYESAYESQERYSGAMRVVQYNELDRNQANKTSLLFESGKILYVKVDENKNLHYVDFNERPVDAPGAKDKIKNIAVPYDNEFSVLYRVNYDSLNARLKLASLQIVLFALAGIGLMLVVSFIISATITRPICDLKVGAAKIASGDFNTRVKVKTKDELGVLAKTFNKMAKALAASTEAMIYKERVKKELDLAANMQQQLLPQEKIELKKMDMAGGLIPATEIGGDAFDYIPMSDGRYLTYLGDVTGHGVAAGIISSITNAVLYGLRSESNLSKIIHQLDDVVREKTIGNMFVTMALGIWDEKKSTLFYANAGHPPILFYEAKKKKVSEIQSPSLALGLGDGKSKISKAKAIKMAPNDVIVMYSDGIPEALHKKNKKEHYGLDKLKKIVKSAADDLYTAEGIKNSILADVMEFIGKDNHDDDITAVVLKRKKRK